MPTPPRHARLFELIRQAELAARPQGAKPEAGLIDAAVALRLQQAAQASLAARPLPTHRAARA